MAGVPALRAGLHSLRPYRTAWPQLGPIQGNCLSVDIRTLQLVCYPTKHRDKRAYHILDWFSTGGEKRPQIQTLNMIIVPLTAGEERIGVLEVLNKVNGDSFTEEERLLLLSISEEIAFAIRNAKVFEYVADSYCRQRQGQPSCRGCRRPLGSWTPCLRYREVSV